MKHLFIHVIAVCCMLCIFVCRSTNGQHGNPCQVNYKTIHENVPYCGVSSWLHWDCLNTCTSLSTQWNNITRLRALCCKTSDCIAECHHPKDHGIETQYCGDVCPPFFTSSLPSTASTRGSVSTTGIWFNSRPGKRQTVI